MIFRISMGGLGTRLRLGPFTPTSIRHIILFAK